MIFCDLFGEQMKIVDSNSNATRSNKILFPIHSQIRQILSEYSKYNIVSLPDKEYLFDSAIGSKKVDIALIDEEGHLKGAVMFKAIRSEYNKNANNYYENMKGESSLFIDNGIPVYQIIFIPTQIHHKNSRGDKIFETPTQKSYDNYYNFCLNHSNYWHKLKLGVYYFDFDYDTYKVSYSNKTIPNVESTLTEGLINFALEVENG